MRKLACCICENKSADQLHGSRAADHRLCFRYKYSTISLLLKSKISSLLSSSWLYSLVCVGPGQKPQRAFLAMRLIHVCASQENSDQLGYPPSLIHANSRNLSFLHTDINDTDQTVAEFLYTVQLVISDVYTEYQADMMETFIGKKEKWTNKGTDDKPYVADSLILSTSCHT